jgi:murein L,D-transpeptidase YafK
VISAEKAPWVQPRSCGGALIGVVSRVRFRARFGQDMQSLLDKVLRFLALAALAVGLSACLMDSGKNVRPLSDEVKAELTSRGLKVGAPIYVRVFKEENALEVWLGRTDGQYVLFRTYEICRWSGKIGPKTFEGDKQAPEGFYVINARQMNPDSRYHLSFNLAYPNAYDRAHGYTGTHLMVHGGCESAGCYAITDEKIEELYALAREAFMGGQREFKVHAFPFRMSEENLARNASSQWYPFWRNLKEGYDLFEATRRPPVVGVKDRSYVFFPDQMSVPPEFLVTQASTGVAGAGPQLITGWVR